MPPLLQFTRFRHRLLVWVVGLLVVAQAATYWLVLRSNRQNALATIEEALERGARQFQAVARRREADLLLAARMMAGDYALRQLFLVPDFSPHTARSALVTYRNRIDAPVIVMLDPQGVFIADTDVVEAEPRHQPFFPLRDQADASERFESAGWGFVGDTLHQIVVVPMLAPAPEVAAWIGVGFPLNRDTADELKSTSALEVTFLTGAEGKVLLASTLPDPLAQQVALNANPGLSARARTLSLDRTDYVTAFRRILTADGQPVWIVLQRSLETELAPSRRVEAVLASVTLAGLIAAIALGLALARSLATPIARLADHTRRISAGDYAARLDLRRRDELGVLANAFNAMSAGLEERDRVRDLLDKNVSPEVATRLLREGAALGGEEREVTVLFADLRGFTTLSEGMAPGELVGVLNRYLDRMSAEIEREGGIVDKYIGDEIMALFGAPVALPDAPDRAVRAALRMRQALNRFNAELAVENHAPLAFGVGIHRARVIAGNIGSQRRLNYSVIGDGVNLAARLQPLTRRPEYTTDIIISEATRSALQGAYQTRELGEVSVKGRNETVHIHAVDSGPLEP